jgi:hypothetical protein
LTAPVTPPELTAQVLPARADIRADEKLFVRGIPCAITCNDAARGQVPHLRTLGFIDFPERELSN